MTEQNPVKQSIEWLVGQGFDEDQATNIAQAIKAETPDQLWTTAPLWMEWCGKVKRDHDCIVMLAAMGAIAVEVGPGGVENDLRMSLKDGIKFSTATEDTADESSVETNETTLEQQRDALLEIAMRLAKFHPYPIGVEEKIATIVGRTNAEII